MRGETMQVHVLDGLDGQNPLGFFAALGVLRALDEVAERAGQQPPQLAFNTAGRTVAMLSTHLSAEELVETLVADAASEAGRSALGLAYNEQGLRCAVHEPKATRDLKPLPVTARELLRETRADLSERRSADLALAFFSELVQDNNGNTKPTSFHFAAGQQQWLDMVGTLRQHATPERLREAMFGPWKEAAAPSLAWDSTVARNYALRATDPSTDKRGSVPGANWLAVIGLTFFPVNVQRGRLETARVSGGWKDSTFVWPLWNRPIPRSVVASLLRGDPESLSMEARDLLGVGQVFACKILRSDQGGYGSFTPADVRGPRKLGR